MYCEFNYLRWQIKLKMKNPGTIYSQTITISKVEGKYFYLCVLMEIGEKGGAEMQTIGKFWKPVVDACGKERVEE